MTNGIGPKVFCDPPQATLFPVDTQADCPRTAESIANFVTTTLPNHDQHPYWFSGGKIDFAIQRDVEEWASRLPREVFPLLVTITAGFMGEPGLVEIFPSPAREYLKEVDKFADENGWSVQAIVRHERARNNGEINPETGQPPQLLSAANWRDELHAYLHKRQGT